MKHWIAQSTWLVLLVACGTEPAIEDTSNLGSCQSECPAGPRGEKGDTGEAGLQGLQGDPGLTGPPGSPGLKGDKGDPGEKGAKGDPGLTGNQGIQGLTGPNGLQGLPGAKGADGTPGQTGAKGDKGDKGDKGIQGEKGQDGVGMDKSKVYVNSSDVVFNVVQVFCNDPEDIVLHGSCHSSNSSLKGFGAIAADDIELASGWQCNCHLDGCNIAANVVCLDL